MHARVTSREQRSRELRKQRSLLRRCADRTGLTGALNAVLPRGRGPGWWDRGTVLVCLATAIVVLPALLFWLAQKRARARARATAE